MKPASAIDYLSFKFKICDGNRRCSAACSGPAFDEGGISIAGRAYPFIYDFVTGDFFSTLGVVPAMGRLIQPGEGEHPGSEPSIVLGYSFWQRRLGGRPDIVGQQIRLNGIAARIIGVAPANFHGVYEGLDPEGYTPIAGLMAAEEEKREFTDRATRPFTAFARMKPGVTIAQAQSAMDVLAARLAQQYPETDKGIGFRVIPEQEARPAPTSPLAQRSPVIRGFLLLLAAVVLALACMNVANLLLVRGTVRQRELAIRAALGSGRARLIRQALTESLLLALLGTVGGLILGKWGSDAFAASIDLATDIPTVLDFSFDWRVFAYALGAAVATGVLIGLWPALRASRTDAAGALHDGSRGETGGPGRQRVRSVLVVGQVAGSMVLLIVAGLFMRSLQNEQNMKLGFEPDRLLNVRMDPSWAGYDAARTKNFYKELERRVAALPGVESASLAFSAPLGYYNSARLVFVEGRPVDPDAQPPLIGCNFVDPPYFDTLKTRILRGRAFAESDDEHAPLVAIVNQTMAARYWPNQDPIGKRFRTGAANAPLVQVVGVAEDGRYVAIAEDQLPYFYVPLAQNDVLDAGFASARAGISGGARAASRTRDPIARFRYAGDRFANHAKVSQRAGRIHGGEARGEAGRDNGNAGPDSRGHRRLRSSLLRRGAAHARDRHPDGDGRQTARRPAAGAAPGRHLGRGRRVRGPVDHACFRAPVEPRPHHGQRHRPGRFPRRNGAANRDRPRSLLYPRVPRHARRPHDGSAPRVKLIQCRYDESSRQEMGK